MKAAAVSDVVSAIVAEAVSVAPASVGRVAALSFECVRFVRVGFHDSAGLRRHVSGVGSHAGRYGGVEGPGGCCGKDGGKDGGSGVLLQASLFFEIVNERTL